MNDSIDIESRNNISRRRSKKLDASSPQLVPKVVAGKPSFHPSDTDHTLKTIEIADDLGSIDVNATQVNQTHNRHATKIEENENRRGK